MLEAYCVDSGRPVRYEAGDRCLHHGNRATPCYTALREARCTHPHLSAASNPMLPGLHRIRQLAPSAAPGGGLVTPA